MEVSRGTFSRWTYLIDGQGKVQAVHKGESDLNVIEDQFESLLRA